MKKLFEKFRKLLSEDYDDDARFSLELKNGVLYYLYSNHHNDELYAIVLPESNIVYQTLEDFFANEEMMEYGGITHVVENALLKCGGVVIGKR